MRCRGKERQVRNNKKNLSVIHVHAAVVVGRGVGGSF